MFGPFSPELGPQLRMIRSALCNEVMFNPDGTSAPKNLDNKKGINERKRKRNQEEEVEVDRKESD